MGKGVTQASARAKSVAKQSGTVKPKAGAKAGLIAIAAEPSNRLRADGEKVAQEVLRLGQAGQDDKILGVLGDQVSREDGGVVARKAFLRISMLIHPDKLPGFPEATRAFQALVKAFDKHQRGFVPASGGELKQKALGRSNDGCFRTEVACPRCRVPWGERSEGNPDYYYNFMMQGLRCFTCAACLLEFGCFSAVHSCPWCKQSFEYTPDQYNKVVTCGRADCKKKFGFMLYHASEQALKAAREQIMRDHEQRTKVEESKLGRRARAERRAGGGMNTEAIAEAAFLEGLRDICPRCGIHLETFEEGAQLSHLRSCNDGRAQKNYRETLRLKEKAAQVKAEKNRKQQSVASAAVWTFCGGHVGKLWMLDDEQLRKHCKQEGLSTRGDHTQMVARLADHCAKRGDTLGHPNDTIPAVLNGVSDQRVESICAAHRLGKLASREERIEALAELRDGTSLLRVDDRTSSSRALADGRPRRSAARSQGTMLAIQDSVAKRPAQAESAQAKSTRPRRD